ncbi:MAG: ferritin-like domain-containing protein [Myxococcaceae bacterium]|nr:ferritin-like domain-containing protein [Myxococcaceae bacterium]
MPMRDLNVKKAQKLLSRIMEFELAGVVRYTHYSLMVAGPNRIPIVAFMKAQASESLLHAQQAGEILTGLGGHPTLQIAPIPETYKHSVKDILEESLSHERDALDLYREFLDEVEDRSVYLEEFARTQIAQEEMHGLEVRKMLRDVAATDHPTHDEVEPDDEADDARDGDEDDARDDSDKKKKKKKKDKKKKNKD